MLEQLRRDYETWSTFKTKVRAFGSWFWDWITVIAATVSGALAFVPDLLNEALAMLDATGIVDFTTFGISPKTAAWITFSVGCAKGYVAWRASRKAV